MFYSTHSSYFILNTHILLDSFTHKKNVFWFICIHTDYFYSFNISHLKLSNSHKKNCIQYTVKKNPYKHITVKKICLILFSLFSTHKNHIHTFSHTILYIMFLIHTRKNAFTLFGAHFLKV